jgi:hypothetical protein
MTNFIALSFKKKTLKTRHVLLILSVSLYGCGTCMISYFQGRTKITSVWEQIGQEIFGPNTDKISGLQTDVSCMTRNFLI